VLSARGLCDGSISRPKESYRARARVCVGVRLCACACVCVSLSAIRRNNNPLHLQWVDRKSESERIHVASFGT
jgi:hypothetical protein